MLRKVIDRFKHPRSSVQYEVQHITPNGGWKNFYRAPGDAPSEGKYDTPPDPIPFDSDVWAPSGRFRCIKRVDGRIREVVWTVESPDADSHYRPLQTKETLRSRLDELDLEEATEAVAAGEFDELSPQEVFEVLTEKQANDRKSKEPIDSRQDSGDQQDLEVDADETEDGENDDQNELSGFEHRLIEGAIAGSKKDLIGLALLDRLETQSEE